MTPKEKQIPAPTPRGRVSYDQYISDAIAEILAGANKLISFQEEMCIEDLLKIANAMPEEREACKDGWHAEENMWGYVTCDCAHCKEARIQIAKQYVHEWEHDERYLDELGEPIYSFRHWVDNLREQDKGEE